MNSLVIIVNKYMKSYILTNPITARTCAVLLTVALLMTTLPVSLAGIASAQVATDPEVTATNFNTHSDTDYMGINVGFTLNSEFGTVSEVRVALHNDDGLIVENTHNQVLLDHINVDGATTLSTPFIMTEGTYTETHWNLGSHNWTENDKPNRAVISVTDETGTYTAENNNLAEPNGWLYETLLPPTPVVTATNFNTHSGTDYKGINVGFTLNDEFGTVSDVRVALFNDGGMIVENTHNQALLDLINDDDVLSHSTPFIMTEGTYVEEYWNLGDHNWTENDKPNRSVISVTDESGTYTAENTNFTEPNDWTFESLIPPTQTTIIVSGDTAAGENQPGWLFNRDEVNATPIEFGTTTSSIGSGSLYVLPLSTTTPEHKFIGELFLNDQMINIVSISYDYRLGDDVPNGSVNEFYANVYANFDDSNDYGHCVYNVIPTDGSAGWHTMTFDPTMDYDVRQRASAPQTCPASPADMGVDAELRMFAINLGDTTDSAAGFDGYFDNVVVETTNSVTTYDFEPETPETSQPPLVGGGPVLTGQRDTSTTQTGAQTTEPAGEVLGATTISAPGTCGMYMLGYAYPNRHATNDTFEVLKLQLFLLSQRLYSANAGTFDAATTAEVMAFQTANYDSILRPWVTAGLADANFSATGNVYKTTLWHINNTVCPGSESFPTLP